MVFTSPETRVFEDELLTLDHADYCAVPGYLILRLRTAVESLAQLDSEAAARVGQVMSRAARAIERAVGAERVYCLSFCEVDRQLHFHLFPRSRRLLDAYETATTTTGEPVNGPLLFEWARTTFAEGRSLPDGFPSVTDTCLRIRRALAEATAVGQKGNAS